MQRGKGRGREGCATGPTAVDSQPQLLIANDVTNAPGDRDGRSPRALPATAGLGSPCEAGADVGDDHGAEVQPGLEAGRTPCVARPLTSAHRQLGLFSKVDVTSDSGTATAPGPAGAQRPCRLATVALGRHRRSDAPSAGTTCPRTPQGTRTPGGRRLPRWVDAPLLDAMEQRGRSRPAVMQQRTPLGEHPFGTMNRWWDAG